MNMHGILRLETVEGTGLRFGARFASGHETTFDSGTDATAANPVEHLLGALAACEAMDVIEILRKKRLEVTAYEVVLEGERSPDPPRRFLSMTLVHRVTGRGIPESALEQAVRLSEEKYCSVRWTLDPQMPVANRWEIVEAD
ncbi:MAG: OsmC family protein [Candidatus Eisenbacteria bacterium]